MKFQEQIEISNDQPDQIKDPSQGSSRQFQDNLKEPTYPSMVNVFAIAAITNGWLQQPLKTATLV